MDVDARDIEMLLDLQELDLKIMAVKRQRAELPQRARMAAVKKKTAEFEGKRAQVEELLEKAKSEISKIETEDSSLAEKQKKAQDLIDASGTDFRRIESHSKEMGGFAKRRETLAARSDELAGHMQKVQEALERIEGGLAKLNAETESIRQSFAQDDGRLASQMENLEAERADLVGKIGAEAYKLYEKTAHHTGGVAIGRLVDNTCGVCRSVIEGGRLIELRAAEPLGVCPSCKRLLVVD